VPAQSIETRFANQQFGEMAGVIFQRVGQLAQANATGRHAHHRPGWLAPRAALTASAASPAPHSGTRRMASPVAGLTTVEEGVGDGQEGVAIDPHRDGLRAFGGKFHAQALFRAL
jgi:hypothetical protein